VFSQRVDGEGGDLETWLDSVDAPKDVRILGGFMYFATGSTIVRAALSESGSGTPETVQSVLNTISGLAIDELNEVYYFVEEGTGVWRAQVNSASPVAKLVYSTSSKLKISVDTSQTIVGPDIRVFVYVEDHNSIYR
jgi:hypothetical protein